MLIMGRARRNRNGFAVDAENGWYDLSEINKCLNVLICRA